MGWWRWKWASSFAQPGQHRPNSPSLQLCKLWLIGEKKYKDDPEIKKDQIVVLTPTKLNGKSSTPKSIDFPHRVWQTLILNIPQEWKNIISHEGNQDFTSGTFYAILIETEIGDVYQYMKKLTEAGRAVTCGPHGKARLLEIRLGERSAGLK